MKKKWQINSVIYEGPHKGIYSNWGLVQKIVRGTSTTIKKFKSLSAAQKEAKQFTKIHGGTISYKNNLVPISPLEINKKRPSIRTAEKKQQPSVAEYRDILVPLEISRLLMHILLGRLLRRPCHLHS